MGDGYSLAWRTLDAQYWLVPQRRRRCYLVFSFVDGTSAGKVLFERKGLSRNFKSGVASREDLTRDSVVGSNSEGRTVSL